MSEKEFNSDEIFRRVMEDLPVEQPQAGEWDALKNRMQKEGILRSGDRRRIIFFFLSILVLGSLAGLYFMNANEGSPTSSNAKSKIELSANSKLISAEKDVTDNANPANNYSTKSVPVTPTPVSLAVLQEKKEISSSSKSKSLKNQPYDLKTTSLPSNASNMNPWSPEVDTKSAPAKNEINEPVENVAPILNASDVISTSSPEIITENKISDSIMNDNANSSPIYIPKRKNNHHWIAGIYISADKNSLGFDPTNAIGKEMIDAGIPVDDNLQFTAGLTLDYKLTSKFTVETGVMYSQKKKFNYSYRKSNDKIPGYEQFDYSFSGHYLEVPLRANFYLFQTHRSRSNWAVYFSPGLIATINLSQKNSDYFIYEALDETGLHSNKISLQMKSVGVALSAAAGLEYKFNREWSMFLEPGYEFHFTSIIQHPSHKEIPVQQYIRTPRVATGLKYNF